MRPRYTADYRTLLWVFILAPGCVAIQYARPDLVKYLWWVSCYFALSCGVIAHNHNHCPTFRSKRANAVFGHVLTFFYGYPTFAWIPTHNLNHHKHLNKAGDATITWRFTNRHTLLVAATYFFVSAYYQAEPTNEFLRKARRDRPQLFRKIVTQYVVWLGAAFVGMLSLAIALHGVSTGLYVWVLTMLVPAVFALWAIMLFNYEQHVHTDPWSAHSHSRNFVGRALNFFLFNNGYHAAHHEHPGTHWSKLPALHAQIADAIHPDLIQHNLWAYWFRQYVLAPFVPRFGSKQVGRAPFDPPDGRPSTLECAEVGLGDAGTNAQRA